MLLALALERGWRPGSRARQAIAGLLVLWVLGRYATVAAPVLYGRPVNLYRDARHLPRVLAMVAEVVSPATVALAGAAVLAALVTLWLLARAASAALLRGLAHRRARRWASGVAAGAVLLLPLERAGLVPDGWVSEPVATTYGRQIGLALAAVLQRSGVTLLPAPLPVDSDLGRLAGGDLYLSEP